MVLDVNRHHNPWLPIRDKCTFGKRLVGEVEGGGLVQRINVNWKGVVVLVSEVTGLGTKAKSTVFSKSRYPLTIG